MQGSQLLFYLWLTFKQPIHCRIEISSRSRLEAELFPEGMTQGVGVEPSCSGEVGLGVEEAGNAHSHNEVSLRAWLGVNEALEASASECPQDRGDMPVGPRTHDVKGIVEVRDAVTHLKHSWE